MNPYDDKNIYDTTRLRSTGNHSVNHHDADSDIANSERGITNDQGSFDQNKNRQEYNKNTDTQQTGVGSFQSQNEVEKIIPYTGKQGKPTKKSSLIGGILGKHKKKIAAGSAMAIGLGVALLVLFTFSVPEMQARAAANGLVATYFGAKQAQGKIHVSRYTTGNINEKYSQVCDGKDCKLTDRKTLLEKFGLRNRQTALRKLEAKGITFKMSAGSFTAFEIFNGEKTSPYHYMNEAEIKADLEKKSGIKVEVKKLTNDSYGLGDRFEVKTSSRYTGTRNSILAATFLQDAADYGKVSKWSATRRINTVLGFGFKPLAKLRASAEERLNNAVNSKLQSWKDSLKNRLSVRAAGDIPITGEFRDSNNPDADPSKESGRLNLKEIQEKTQKALDSKAGRISGGGLVVAGGICVVAATISGANAMTQARFNGVSGELATDILAAGDSVNTMEESPDFDREGIEAFNETYLEVRDPNGNYLSFDQSRAYRQMNGMDTGKEVPAGVALMGGINTTETMNVRSQTSKDGGGARLSDVIASACGNEIISGLLTVGGIAFMIASGPFGVLEGIVLGGLGVIAAQQAMNAMSGTVDTDLIMSDPAYVYGTAAAGAKNIADMGAFTNGGDPDPNGEQFNKFSSIAMQEQRDEFESKSVAYRVLNTKDPLSLASRVAVDKGSRYIEKNLSNIASSFIGVFSTVGKQMSSLTTKKVSAQENYTLDTCKQTIHGCVALSDDVLDDDGSKAIAFLEGDPSAENPHLKYMKECRDNEFYKDSQGAWTFRVVEGTPAYMKHLTNTLGVLSNCESMSGLDESLITSLKAYTHLETIIAGQVCLDSPIDSYDEVDRAACEKMGYSTNTTTPATETETVEENTNSATEIVPDTAGEGNYLWPLKRNPIVVTNCYKSTHAGLDFRAAVGTPIIAVLDGVVVKEASSGDTGNALMIRLSDGKYVNYQHLSKKFVGRGDAVKKGQIIGETGNTGYSTGPHLHFVVSDRDNWGTRRVAYTTLNPKSFLPSTGATWQC